VCWQSLAAVLAGLSLPAAAATWYISPTGSDTNPGTLTSPLATIMAAQTKASAGDIVWILGGTYTLPNAYNSIQSGVYATVNLINKNGITYEAGAGTRPVFDFSNVNPPGDRVAAFWVTATGVTFQGFDVVGVRENITTANNQSLGFGIWGGKHCTWNEVNVHDADAVGFYAEEVAANNLFYRCDSYNNAGINSYSYGNADGFGCHPAAGGTNNIFRECRSWNNSDDGYDCINAAETVTFDHCWSYMNGNNGGNGNGFKVGGWGSQPQDAIPNPLPAHVVFNCLSAGNNSHGFYANHQPGRAAGWTNNTAYGNGGADFDMLERTPPNYATNADQTDANDIAGTNEVMHFNLAYAGYATTGDYGETGSPLVSSNSWSEAGVTAGAADFQSTALNQITNARAADGSLPVITCLHLVSGDHLTGLGCFVAPPAPATVTATAGNARVSLSWTAASGAAGYNLKRAAASAGPYYTIVTNTPAMTATDSGLTNGTACFYVVSSLNPGDESTDSSPASAIPEPVPAPVFVSALAQGGNLIWSGMSGASNAVYYVLTSTNLNLPAAQWTRLATNYFDASGGFAFTNAAGIGGPPDFFRLLTP